MEKTRDWSPLNDLHPNLRDILAMAERTSPTMSIEEVCDYLDLKPGEKYEPLKHYPLVMAKWRYECADAMLKYGGYAE